MCCITERNGFIASSRRGGKRKVLVLAGVEKRSRGRGVTQRRKNCLLERKKGAEKSEEGGAKEGRGGTGQKHAFENREGVRRKTRGRLTRSLKEEPGKNASPLEEKEEHLRITVTGRERCLPATSKEKEGKTSRMRE